MLSDRLTWSGKRWAWQGAADAPARWAGQTGSKDLDCWCDEGADPRAAMRDLVVATIVETTDPSRLRHTVLAIETDTGLAVVDVTIGDLRVGPVLMVPAADITVETGTRRLSGAAAVADLVVRPLLRGRIPEPARLAEARWAWANTDDRLRQRLITRLARQLGHRFAGELTRVLGSEPATIDPGLPRVARLRLLARSLAPSALASTVAARRTILPAGRAAGPLGQRVHGVVVVLIGTDGSGKSTIARTLDARLRRCGFGTASAYFGMARGNLPGVGLARRLLGVHPEQMGQATPARKAEDAGDAGETGDAGDGQRPAAPAADHRFLRRLAAWYYAAEYCWRYLRDIAPRRLARQVVIVDRWVFDLEHSPWPGSPAAGVVRLILPRPDIVALPDAPIEVIHDRQPERPLPDQAAEQERYRAVLAGLPARHAELSLDTSGSGPDGLAELVAAVVEAAHGPRRRGRADRPR